MGEETEKKETSKILEMLTTKIDELTKVIREEKVLTKEEIDETSKEDQILVKLTEKIEELTTAIKEKKAITEEKIRENPLAYVIGAFIGGLVVGFVFRKGTERTEGKE